MCHVTDACACLTMVYMYVHGRMGIVTYMFEHMRLVMDACLINNIIVCVASHMVCVRVASHMVCVRTSRDNRSIVSSIEMSALTSMPIDWKLGR